VLRPPGGGYSNIFGFTEEQKPTESVESNENRAPSQPVIADTGNQAVIKLTSLSSSLW